MTGNEYQRLAARTIGPGLTKDEVLLNAVLGLGGESGEVIDLIKKERFHGHPRDREKLIKELGDVAWYLAEAATALDVPLEDILTANIEKLWARYPDGFSQERSLHRKAEDQ